MSSILFVCTGNVCRSPMAAGLLRASLAGRGLEAEYRISSAGVWALDDRPASENAVAVMAERGINITGHIAHTISADDVAAADLILVMGQEHAGMICSTWPQYAWKVHRLSEMCGKRKDIPDPFDGSLERYRACARQISDYIDRGLERILELA